MVSLRPAQKSDWARLFFWRNHPSTRAQFVNGEPVSLAAHVTWMENILASDQARLFVAADSERSVTVGTARLDLDTKKKSATVSLTVDPEQRGRGYASQILRKLEVQAGLLKVEKLVATVFEGNASSLRAFADAEYCLDAVGPADDKKGHVVTLVRMVSR